MEPRIVEKRPITVVGVEFNPEEHGWHLVPTLFLLLCRMMPTIGNVVNPHTRVVSFSER